MTANGTLNCEVAYLRLNGGLVHSNLGSILRWEFSSLDPMRHSMMLVPLLLSAPNQLETRLDLSWITNAPLRLTHFKSVYDFTEEMRMTGDPASNSLTTFVPTLRNDYGEVIQEVAKIFS